MATDLEVLDGEAFEGGGESNPHPEYPNGYYCCVQILNPAESGKLVFVDRVETYHGYYKNLAKDGDDAGNWQSAWSVRQALYDDGIGSLIYRWKNCLSGGPDGVAEIRRGYRSAEELERLCQTRHHERGDGRVNGSRPVTTNRVLLPGRGLLWVVTATPAMLRVQFDGREKPILTL